MHMFLGHFSLTRTKLNEVTKAQQTQIEGIETKMVETDERPEDIRNTG